MVVVVHHLEQARAALAAAAAAGCAIELRSASGAAGYAGVGYLKALGEQVGQELLIDCGDDAGLVMAALRTGCRRLVFRGSEEIRRRLEDMAEQRGAELVAEAPAPEMLILLPDDDGAAALSSRVRAMP
jgi:acyl-CoA reductase-like NAD-dependent aldehyde dehydrogenase